MQYLARYGRVWQHVQSGQTYGGKLELKDGESLSDYRQIAAPKEQPAKQKAKQTAKTDLSFAENNNDKGETI